MAKRDTKSKRRTAEGQESLMIKLAMDQAEEQLRNKTAPSQIVTHFLKLATLKAQAELEKIRSEAKVATSKALLFESQQRSEEIAERALEAFKTYAGISSEELTDDEEDDYYEH